MNLAKNSSPHTSSAAIPNPETPKGPDMTHWTQELFSVIDAKDADAFASFLAEDAVFRFGNAPAAHGRAAIREAVTGFFGAIAGLRHTVADHWDAGDAIFALGEVTYTRLDGSTLTVPFADVLKMRAGKIGEYLIYIDASELFATNRS